MRKFTFSTDGDVKFLTVWGGIWCQIWPASVSVCLQERRKLTVMSGPSEDFNHHPHEAGRTTITPHW